MINGISRSYTLRGAYHSPECASLTLLSACRIPHVVLSEPFEALHIDLQSRLCLAQSRDACSKQPEVLWESMRTVSISLEQGGRWNGIAYWFQVRSKRSVVRADNRDNQLVVFCSQAWLGADCNVQADMHGGASISNCHLEGQGTTTGVWGQAVQYIDEIPVEKVNLHSTLAVMHPAPECQRVALSTMQVFMINQS